MTDVQRSAPFVVEIITHQSAVTVVWCCFRAQQAAALEYLGLQPRFDLARRHERQEQALIDIPVAFIPLVCLQYIICRGQKRLVDILSAANLLQEIGEIIGFGEACELRCVVKADIDDLLYARFSNPIEERRSCRLREAYRRNIYLVQSHYSTSTSFSASVLRSVNATLNAWSR